MYTPTTHWDRPPTDRELNQFNGTVPSQWEVNRSLTSAALAFDGEDLAMAASENADELFAALKAGDAVAFMAIFENDRRATIARRASLIVFGTTDSISASEVTT
jgi:hypothetical protein